MAVLVLLVLLPVLLARVFAIPADMMCPTYSTHFLCDVSTKCAEQHNATTGICSWDCSTGVRARCLHRKYLCDGVPDCEDGSDEQECLQCAPEAFHCRKCVRRETLCRSDHRHCRRADLECPEPRQQPEQPEEPDACPELDRDVLPGTSVSCDGHHDCPDRRDELLCSSPEQCQGDSFFCDGGCRRGSRLCDGYPDCEDGSDELHCPANMRRVAVIPKQGEGVATKRECFDCGNGRCVSPSVKCDGVDDCGNAKDEKRCFAPVCAQGGGKNCVTTKCSEQGIPCRAGYKCGRLKWACDGHPQCDGEVDEHNCTAPAPKTILCHDGTPRLESTRCDGVPDCPDGEDEMGCSRCYDGAVRCDGRCVMASRVCDGYHDCYDGADERGCQDYLRLAHTFFHPRVCGPGRVDCGNRCVDNKYVCDGAQDCENNADEVNCNGCRRGSLHCNSRCFRPVYACHWEKDCDNVTRLAALPADSGRCDGVRDCEDGSDEEGCTANTCAGFYCDAACRPESIVCDGVRDCKDGEDEAGCPEELANTTMRETWIRRNHRVEFTWTYNSFFTYKNDTYNVTTVINDTMAVITSDVPMHVQTKHGKPCPTTTTTSTTTTTTTTTTPEPPSQPPPPPAPVPVGERRGRKRGGAGGARKGGRRRKQQANRRQRKQDVKAEA